MEPEKSSSVLAAAEPAPSRSGAFNFVEHLLRSSQRQLDRIADVDDQGQRLAPCKCARYVQFVSELPKTATGKIQRFKLREREQSSA